MISRGWVWPAHVISRGWVWPKQTLRMNQVHLSRFKVQLSLCCVRGGVAQVWECVAGVSIGPREEGYRGQWIVIGIGDEIDGV